MISPLVKFVCLAALLLGVAILLFHVLPWLVVVLAIFGGFKLYEIIARPTKLPPPRWPWKDH